MSKIKDVDIDPALYGREPEEAIAASQTNSTAVQATFVVCFQEIVNGVPVGSMQEQPEVDLETALETLTKVKLSYEIAYLKFRGSLNNYCITVAN